MSSLSSKAARDDASYFRNPNRAVLKISERYKLRQASLSTHGVLIILTLYESYDKHARQQPNQDIAPTLTSFISFRTSSPS